MINSFDIFLLYIQLPDEEPFVNHTLWAVIEALVWLSVSTNSATLKRVQFQHKALLIVILSVNVVG